MRSGRQSRPAQRHYSAFHVIAAATGHHLSRSAPVEVVIPPAAIVHPRSLVCELGSKSGDLVVIGPPAADDELIPTC